MVTTNTAALQLAIALKKPTYVTPIKLVLHAIIAYLMRLLESTLDLNDVMVGLQGCALLISREGQIVHSRVCEGLRSGGVQDQQALWS